MKDLNFHLVVKLDYPKSDYITYKFAYTDLSVLITYNTDFSIDSEVFLVFLAFGQGKFIQIYENSETKH